MLIPLGTNEGVISYPDEQIGFLASDQYSSRITTPAQGSGYTNKLHSNTSQPNFESPLRTTSFPTDNFQRNEFDKSKGSVSGKSDAIDSETEEDVIHVDDPARRYNKVTGGEETMNEAEDLGPNGGNAPEQAGYLDESGYGVPILASDEVAKDIGGEHMQPAVSPKHERRSSIHFVGDENGSGNITPTSRPTSRPGSTHGLQTLLSRFVSRHDDREEIHTPLEDVEEYEPLFPDEDESKKRPVNSAERFKQRPDTLKHRFPSQDIWEDTPSSAMHVATITTPDPMAQNDSAIPKPVSNEFEDPSTESARKGEVDEADKAELLPKEEGLAKSRFATHLQNGIPARPGMQQRFPSRDIWEDTPDSMQLVTTVASPPPPLGAEQKSPEDAASNKPSIPPRALNRSKLGESSTIPNVPVSAEVNQPQVPARPPKRMHAVPAANAKLHDVAIPPSQTLDKNITPTEGTKGPGIPDRPKPPVPARPAKKESLEALTKARSGGSSGSQDTVASPPLPKAKPAIPARPGGNKPNLPTAFMSDLNQRLQLGPRPPTKEKEVEPEAEREAVRLPDARKNRAKGPQRRAPAKPSSDLAEATQLPIPEFTISISIPLWSINEDEGLIVTNYEKASSLPQQSISKALAEDIGSKTTATASIDAADAPKLLSSKGVSMSASNESVDPSQVDSATATPGAEKADPLIRSIGSVVHEDREGFPSLSEQTTASSGGTSGAPLERVESKNEEASKSGTEVSGAGHVSGVEHNTLSETTTSSSLSSCERHKNVSTHEPRAAADQKVRDNDLAADSGAKPLSQHEPPATTVETASIFENDDVNIGEGQEKEPGYEGTGHGEMRTESGMKTNIPDKKLEEMTAMADGKGHAPGGEGSVKGT
jgi:Altered inheritance of mitochondria protein 21